MAEQQSQGVSIDYQRHRALFEERKEEYAQGRGEPRLVARAKVRLLEDLLKEAEFRGGFKALCDEPAERGGSSQGPTPLEYLVASVGF